jgi:hypothetical protein
VIDSYLGGEDWDEAPASMAFEAPYGAILDEIASLVGRLRSGGDAPPADSGDAVRLYMRGPALVNVLLNYKICVEHGLPLHPTVYYELAEARRYKVDHPLDEIERANRLFRESIELSRAAYRLDPDWKERAEDFKARLPPEVPRFVYTGGQDKYTWRASEPSKLALLASSIRKSFAPEIIVAAAHGSIMPALLLSEYLGLPLYFIRFSMFKRNDETPIVSLADEVWLSPWSGGRALIYDEDVAKGTTLELFSRRLNPFFAETRSACSIRHAGAALRPDFFAKVWWD